MGEGKGIVRNGSGISRRSFLTGAAATGALAALGMAGCAPKSRGTGPEAAVAAADGEAAREYLAPGDYTVSETKDYDVVVVGGGGAGMCAATRAAQLGLKAVLLEQMDDTGGTSQFTEGVFAVNSHIQKEAGTDPADLGYDIFTMAMEYHHWLANGSLFRAYLDGSGPDIDWLESIGVEFSGAASMSDNEYKCWHQYVYLEGEVSGKGYVTHLNEAVKKAGAEIVTGAEAVDIIMDGETAAGIVAKQGSKFIQYNGSKGIILCSGGYASNKDMMSEFGKPGDRIQAMGMSGRNGFGINAARKAGAVLAYSPGTMMYYGGVLPGINYGTHLYSASAFQPYFWVNETGRRFVNEYYAERNFSFSGDAQSVQDRVISIVTQKQMDNMYKNGGTFGCGEYLHAGEPLTDLWKEYDAQVEAGNEAIHKCDTLDALADELGLDAAALKDEVEKYNGYCKKGVDEEFGKDKQYLFALEKGPYYAFELNVGIFCTSGGVKVDNKMQAIREDGTPVPHLYCCGNDAGGLYGDAYDVKICEGSAQGFAVFSGKTAAESAAEN